MSIVEIGALAQLVGAIAILLSLVFVVIELRKNFRQNDLANSLQRAIDFEKLNYAQMDENMAKVITKAYRSYIGLSDYEKIQFEGYFLQRISIGLRTYRTADETAFKLGSDYLRNRLKLSMEEFFSHPGVRACYDSMNERNLIHGNEMLITLVGEDVLAQPAA